MSDCEPCKEWYMHDLSLDDRSWSRHDHRDLSLEWTCATLRWSWVEKGSTIIEIAPQLPDLCDGQLRSGDIRYADFNATDAEIECVCRTARIHDDLISFLDGYATKISKNGRNA